MRANQVSRRSIRRSNAGRGDQLAALRSENADRRLGVRKRSPAPPRRAAAGTGRCRCRAPPDRSCRAPRRACARSGDALGFAGQQRVDHLADRARAKISCRRGDTATLLAAGADIHSLGLAASAPAVSSIGVCTRCGSRSGRTGAPVRKSSVICKTQRGAIDTLGQIRRAIAKDESCLQNRRCVKRFSTSVVRSSMPSMTMTSQFDAALVGNSPEFSRDNQRRAINAAVTASVGQKRL